MILASWLRSDQTSLASLLARCHISRLRVLLDDTDTPCDASMLSKNLSAAVKVGQTDGRGKVSL